MEDVTPGSGLPPTPSNHIATGRTTPPFRIRQVPKIDGSQGAFIGVVVALSVLIVVCCAAVFYLLRHHEPTDQDRTARRERYRRTREHTLNSSTTVVGPAASTVSSLGDKAKNLWQSTIGTGMGGGGWRGRRGGRGWIRAGSNDEWASHSDHESSAGVDPDMGGSLSSFPATQQHTRNDGIGGHGIRVIELPLSDTASGLASTPYAYAYTDQFPKSASQGALHQPQLPLSSPMSSPRERTSLDEIPEVHSPDDDPRDHRHRSTMSNGSVWTHAGSKFVEDI